MTRSLKWMGIFLVTVVLLGTAAALVGIVNGPPFAHSAIEVNGQPFVFGDAEGGDWLGGAIGALVGLVVVVFVVPLAVLLPLLIVGGVLLAMVVALAGLAALLFSPLLLCVGAVWLVWRLARGKKARTTANTPSAGSIAA